ncbi:DNA-binding protein [Bacillus thuringiensis]|uniref:DNA-binding protein n=1 Tax=Bacillus TaxID=1386 RepID=UPI0009C1135B|nr:MULTISPECIES: DNA-binding protein [Bacillus cereus group]MDO6632326.1 DNA-binding protein [Bacillus thuringiensis]MDO6661858.1 DNA-binding protein [Bacillus thuringiensis]MDO6699629.1 DNA-binding protein [Bacillus thuringiensis]MED2031506.1 DNA-binding protein [Bacillus thuringiensis]TKA03623.1 DNA-binding protein [Bacillus thuringiensis]
MFSFLWIVYMPLLVLCGFFGGIFLIITSIKHRKLFVGLMGVLSFSFVTLPFVFWSMGVNSETILPISTTLYWIFFSLTGLLAGVRGLQMKIKSIRNMGFIIFIAGLLGVIFWELMSAGDSFYI